MPFKKDLQYYKFCLYGFLKNLRFFDPFMVLFLIERGLPYLEIGVLYAIKEIFINVSEIPSGVMADAFGRRKTMVASFLAYIASFIVFFIGKGFFTFSIAMVLFAFGDAFRTGTHKAMIFEYLRQKGWENQKVYYYGHTRSWSQIGSAVSALLAGAMVFWRRNYSSVFLFSTIPYVLDLFLMISYPASLDRKITEVDGGIKHAFQSVIRDLIKSLKNTELLKIIGNQALYSGYYKACKDFLQPVIKSFALALPLLTGFETEQRTAVLVGVVYSALYFLTSYSAAAAGSFSSRFGDTLRTLQMTLLIGAIFGAAAGLSFAAGFPGIAILLYVGIYLIENLRKPIGIGMVGDRIQKDALASALSAESQVESLFAAFFAIFLGAVSQRWGLPVGLITVSVFTALSGLILTSAANKKLA